MANIYQKFKWKILYMDRFDRAFLAVSMLLLSFFVYVQFLRDSDWVHLSNVSIEKSKIKVVTLDDEGHGRLHTEDGQSFYLNASDRRSVLRQLSGTFW